ncbi:hypothetical protein [Delftia tsuruhatensis]|uniref:hypothetical protein n=1 Tax=Delftia tsuruhatensis TaxID=180282 RepID=UPI001417B52D|nr:MAG: hypothetical protein GAK34_02738 [Delftia tsuruhatensis]
MKVQLPSFRVALVLLSLLCGLLGFGLVVAGIWRMHPPTAMVVAGVALVAYAWRVDRAASGLAALAAARGEG